MNITEFKFYFTTASSSWKKMECCGSCVSHRWRVRRRSRGIHRLLPFLFCIMVVVAVVMVNDSVMVGYQWWKTCETL